jgi:tetratricopeptide (TPR) repeat protein
MMKKTIPLIIALLIISSFSPALAETKTFIKEYIYQASDFDSKMSSRTIALEQVKRLLLEEVGTYLISETEVKDFQLTKDKITTLTAGIVQAEILNEQWDGRTYYLKAKMSIAPQEVTKFLEGLRENSQKNRELEETNRKVDEALKRIKKLQDDLTSGQHVERKQTEYSKAVAELKAKEWIDKGVAFMNAENYESGLSAFNNAAEIDPTSSWAHINKGWALNTLGDYYQALKEFDRASDIDPKNPWIYVNRGMSYNSLGDYRQALVEEDKAINLDANIAWSYIGRGWAYVGIGNFKQAVTELDRASQLEPKNSFVYSTRLWAYNALGDTQRTLGDLDKSIELAPNNSWMHWNVAVFYALTGEKRKAIAALGRAIKFNGGLRQGAKTDKNFQSLWNDADFKKLVE